jgi:hypothetical protein
MYAKTQWRPPPSRPFLNLLRFPCIPALALRLQTLTGRYLDVVGVFSNTHKQALSSRDLLPSRAHTHRSGLLASDGAPTPGATVASSAASPTPATSQASVTTERATWRSGRLGVATSVRVGTEEQRGSSPPSRSRRRRQRAGWDERGGSGLSGAACCRARWGAAG